MTAVLDPAQVSRPSVSAITSIAASGARVGSRNQCRDANDPASAADTESQLGRLHGRRGGPGTHPATSGLTLLSGPSAENRRGGAPTCGARRDTLCSSAVLWRPLAPSARSA